MDDTGVINGRQNGRLRSARAYQLAREREFPLPVKIAGNVQLYDRAKVRTWIDQRDQQPPTKAQERRRKISTEESE